jgi:hypothetical protein
MKSRAALLFTGVSIVTTPLEAWSQCAMCVTALQNSAEGKLIAESFGIGILFLLAVPYVIFGAFGYTVYRAYRRKSHQPPKGVL